VGHLRCRINFFYPHFFTSVCRGWGPISRARLYELELPALARGNVNEGHPVFNHSGGNLPMRKNCLTAFCSATFCICKLPLRKRDLFLKTTTKRLSIWRQKRTMRWMAGYLGGTCIKNILNFHGIQMNGSDVDTFGCLSCIWRGMALPSLGLRPISSSALCASLIATESAESNLQMTGWEHEKRHLSLGH